MERDWRCACAMSSWFRRWREALAVRMNQFESDDLSEEASMHFRSMIESVGVKHFAEAMSLSTRQINRMLSGAQPNPVERIIRCTQACDPEAGDEALAFVCQEAGGFFVKDETALDGASVNAVRECAEAIAAISDGQVTRVDQREVREAITALTALLRAVQEQRRVSKAGAASIQTRPIKPPTRDGVRTGA